MKIETKSLISATRQALPLATKRTTMPVLNHMLVSAQAGKLTLTTSDLEARQTVLADCDGDLDPCCVPAKMFTALIQNGNGSVELGLVKDSLSVKSGWTSKLPTVQACEFPAAPTDKLVGVGVNCADLAEGIEGVSWAAMDAKDCQLTGLWKSAVMIDLEPKRMRVSAYDGPCACLFERGVIASQFQALMPAKQASDIAAALKSSGSVLSANESWLVVTHDRGSFACKLVDEAIKDLFGKAPKDSDVLAEFDRDSLIASLESCQALDPDDKFGQKATITFAGQKVTVSCETRHGGEYSAEMDGITGDFKSCFSTKRLSLALKSCTADKIKWRQEDDMAGAMFRYGDFLTCIMGMRMT